MTQHLDSAGTLRALWAAEARVSAQRTSLEQLFEQRLETRRAQAALEVLLRELQTCLANRARAAK